jgi:hypothetical protein
MLVEARLLETLEHFFSSFYHPILQLPYLLLSLTDFSLFVDSELSVIDLLCDDELNPTVEKSPTCEDHVSFSLEGK